MPNARNRCSRVTSKPLTSARMRQTTSGSSRPATPPLCGKPSSDASMPPPKSIQKNCTSSGVWVKANDSSSERSRVDLPDCGPPVTTA
jgi:hypothetical protein